MVLVRNINFIKFDVLEMRVQLVACEGCNWGKGGGEKDGNVNVFFLESENLRGIICIRGDKIGVRILIF